MKVLIDIPQEMFKATQTYYSDFTTCLSMKKCTEIIANGTPIPDGATNGDVIKAMFSDTEEIEERWDEVVVKALGSHRAINLSWWNAPYKGVEK